MPIFRVTQTPPPPPKTMYVCAKYSDRTEFDSSIQPTVTPILRRQQILENDFQLREKSQNGAFGRVGISYGKFS